LQQALLAVICQMLALKTGRYNNLSLVTAILLKFVAKVLLQSLLDNISWRKKENFYLFCVFKIDVIILDKS
jgi:hypothetical protein